MSHSVKQSFKVAATLAAQRFVAMNGTANTVAYPTGEQILPVGVTLDTVKALNQAIPVAMPGSIVEVYCNDTITAGAPVASDTSGRAIPYVLSATTTAGLADCYAGHLVGAAVAATGTIAKILIAPGFAK